MEAENAFVSLNAKKDDIMYMNSKFSAVNVTDPNLTISKNDKTNEEGQEGKFYDMVLSKDPHFNDVLVNTNYSSVHVPTNIYDRCKITLYEITFLIRIQ